MDFLMTPIVSVTIMVGLSLIVALFVFGILRSTAIVKKAGYQAGGALAGFLLIYPSLHYSFNSLKHHELQERKLQTIWTIKGVVKRVGSDGSGMIAVRTDPKSNYIMEQEEFNFDVRRMADDNVEIIRFEDLTKEYDSRSIQIGKDVQPSETNPGRKVVYIDIELRKENESEQTASATPADSSVAANLGDG